MLSTKLGSGDRVDNEPRTPTIIAVEISNRLTQMPRAAECVRAMMNVFRSPSFFIFISLLIVAGVFSIDSVLSQAKSNALREIELQLDDVTVGINRQLSTLESTLNSVLELPYDFSPDDWQNLEKTILGNVENKVVESFGFIQYVTSDQIPLMVTKVQNQAGPNQLSYKKFQVFPLSENSDHFVLKYRSNGIAALREPGYDFGVSDAERTFLETARDSGRSFLTRSPLVSADAALLTLVKPLYEGSELQISVSERRRNLIGFVLATFKPALLIERALRESEVGREINLEARLDLDGVDLAVFPPESSELKASTESKFRVSKVLDALNYRWLIVLGSSAGLGVIGEAFLSIVAVASVFGILILSTIVIWVSSEVRAKRLLSLAETLGQGLGERELQLSLLSDVSPAGLIVVNASGEIVYTNRAFTEILECQAGDLLGKNWLNLVSTDEVSLVSGEWDRAVDSWQRLNTACHLTTVGLQDIFVVCRGNAIMEGDQGRGYVISFSQAIKYEVRPISQPSAERKLDNKWAGS